MIEALRFVLRDGKRILQMAEEFDLADGETIPRWEDVPLVESE